MPRNWRRSGMAGVVDRKIGNGTSNGPTMDGKTTKEKERPRKEK